MPSPPRLPRGSPPRRALHERSESHTNEWNKSTLRMVEDEKPYIYGESPYPIKPSQVLLPSGHYPQQSTSLQGTPYEQVPLSDTSRLHREDEPSKERRAAASRQGSDAGRLTGRSSADLSFYTASARDSTAFATPLQERNVSALAFNQPGLLTNKVANDANSFMDSRSEARHGGASSAAISERQPSSKDSENSLSSVNSTGTVIVRKTRDGKKRVSYSAFPSTGRPSSSRSNMSTPASQTSSPKVLDEHTAPPSPVSPISPIVAPHGTLSDRRNASAPAGSRGNDSIPLQYPVTKPPSASGSWAKSTVTAPPIPPRALERAQQRWNPHLSTVESEGTGSVSGGRTSQGLWLSDSSRASQTSSRFLSPRLSSTVPPVPSRDGSDTASTASGQVNPTLHLSDSSTVIRNPAPVRQRDSTASTIRIVGDREDGKLEVPPTIPGSRDSENALPKAPGSRQAGQIARPGSRASFFRDSIPAWAKTYYGRPTSSSSASNLRDSTATENISINMLRPQERLQRSNLPYDRRISGLSMHPTKPEDLNLTGITGAMQRRISPSWSPHLWHDRTSLGRRRTIFQAPSDGQVFDGRALTKRNIQILMFALGFIFPLSWFIASFLPLPPKPAGPPAKGKGKARDSRVVPDLEKQLGPTDLSRYETARWWRTINRMMCLVGVAVIVIIIVLTAVAATT